MIQEAQSAREYQAYPLLKLFVEISCEMMMSELEIAGFCIYLRRFIWPTIAQNLTVLLYAVAFAIKYQFSSNLDPLIGHLKEKIPGFLQYFNSWMNRMEESLKIEMSELNKVFETLVKPPFEDVSVDYNFYVDVILEMAPASVYEKPPWQEQLLNLSNLQEIPTELPTFMKLDSLLIGFEGLPMLDRMMSTASNGSWFNQYPDLNEI